MSFQSGCIMRRRKNRKRAVRKRLRGRRIKMRLMNNSMNKIAKWILNMRELSTAVLAM
jgi:hypothetical protein